MTTPIEQVFLYGEESPEFPVSGILAQVWFSDLTNGGAVTFALLLLTCTIIGFWDDLTPWISLAVSTLVVSPITVLVSGAYSFLAELAAARSVGELKTTLLVNVHRVLHPIVAALLGCLAPLKWWFPSNQPQTMTCRLSGSFAASMVGYYGFLLPTAQYLYGASEGLMSASWEQSQYCLDVLNAYDAVWRPSRRLWVEACYCFGEEASLQLQAIIEDDWELPHRFALLANGETHHLRCIACVVICALLVITAASASDIRDWTVSLLARVLVRIVDAADKARPQGVPLTLRESRLWDRINSYEVDLAKLKGLLQDITEELRVTKLMRGDGLGQLNIQIARWRQSEDARSKDHALNLDLQRQIGRLVWQLRSAQRAEADAASRERALTANMASLARRAEQAEKSLSDEQSIISSLRAELQARNEQLATIEHRLAASPADAPESQSQCVERLEADRQKSSAEITELISSRDRLQEQYDEILNRHDDYYLRFGTVEEIEAIARERDTVKGQLADLMARLEAISRERDNARCDLAELMARHNSMISVADNYYQETQMSLAQAEQRDVVLRQTIADVRGACDMVLAQEAKTADDALQKASKLETEVCDLRLKLEQVTAEAKKSHEEAESSKATILDLERRLANYTPPESSTQWIPKVQTGNPGSIQTALEQSQVTVSKQQMEIEALKRQLEETHMDAERPAEDGLREEISKLRKALEAEKRARSEDQLRWHKTTSDLEAENRRLTIAQSNMAATMRGGSMRGKLAWQCHEPSASPIVSRSQLSLRRGRGF
ncbi:hypothetical protein PHISCL_07478 [Aspergillus sclerotialis]|uniref:Integral membrane protein n=1 Tax=Aspergillus sclerotialis TaxID=2070753 RepID=A0A3A2ZC36_9EURO|nr:hypothetical protein PHISCL_07478 [Aspergillus sclerotialis]